MIYIDNLSEFVKLLIDNSEEGLFFPQNNEYSNTSYLVKLIGQSMNKKVRLFIGLGWLIKLSGLVIKKLTKAANAAQKITKNSGDKSINVTANASGTEQTDKLATAVKGFRKLDSKTIKLKAGTSGLGGTIALTAAAKSVINLNDKD